MTKNVRPATSDDIPRAVEFLIGMAIGCVCMLLAGGLALLAFVAWFKAWTWWKIPLLVSTVLALCIFAFRPRGKIVFDQVGPSVIVPKPPTRE